ncbi:hypothetical protein N505_0114555 [Rhodococcus aetherivorans]|nr:hypothetical protein N505_0114555 [Rhodococcus aetherivorans]
MGSGMGRPRRLRRRVRTLRVHRDARRLRPLGHDDRRGVPHRPATVAPDPAARGGPRRSVGAVRGRIRRPLRVGGAAPPGCPQPVRDRGRPRRRRLRRLSLPRVSRSAGR